MFKVSIFIPTKNPGKEFEKVIDRCTTQKTKFPYEIILIDSGTKDDSLDFLINHTHINSIPIHMHYIEPQDFGHGKTRNMGITLSNSKYIAMLTQDALPFNEHWLQKLVDAIDLNPKIAGVFGRHEAYPEASLFTKRNIRNLFDFINKLGGNISQSNFESVFKGKPYQELYHFFSDNNSLIRRSIWRKIPYPDVEFAEDQIWANKILEAGYIKAYADEAIVYHSHNYGILESFQRFFDETRALNILFGIKPIPNLLYLFGSPIKNIAGDTIYYFRKKNKTRLDAYWFIRMPIDHFLKAIAKLIGQYHKNMPNFIIRFFSRDHRLFIS